MTEADARAGPTVRVTAVQTGSIRIRPAHRAGRMDRPAWRRRLAILRDRDWTESLPIHTYLVEHPEGLFLFDAGETARTATRGFLPWWRPAWFEPDRISVDGPAVGPWPRSHPVTEDGRIVAVETPGHMPGHLSLIVSAAGTTYLLAGDATYDEGLARAEIVDGAQEDVAAGVRTLRTIKEFARQRPVVLLPAHDPLAVERLARRTPFDPDGDAAG